MVVSGRVEDDKYQRVTLTNLGKHYVTCHHIKREKPGTFCSLVKTASLWCGTHNKLFD